MGTTKPRTNKIPIRKKVSIPPAPPPGKGPAPRRFAQNIRILGPGTLPHLPPTQVTFDNPRKAAQGPAKRAGHLAAAATAMRKQSLEARATPPPSALPKLTLVAEPWVHVSNLDPEAVPNDLADHFKGCPGFKYVDIRYSSGGVPGRAQNGYRYAVVKFEEAAQADAALQLHGTKLGGSEYQLVVTPDLLTLPEVQKLPEFRQAVRAQPSLAKNLPLYHPVPRLPDNSLQTASGLTANSPIVKTNVWKPPRRVSARKTKGKKPKTVIVGGVQYTRS
ncbi:hypothetical protein C8R45DRAFT_1113632 [Mycena sanguinolenta]|nr:hypothetical protein C8R45DRAFT_1113632 [Mycena sanguinolenta]